MRRAISLFRKSYNLTFRVSTTPWWSSKLKWQEFIRMPAAVPLMTLKPHETEAFFQLRAGESCTRMWCMKCWPTQSWGIWSRLLVRGPRLVAPVSGETSECYEKCMESGTARSGQQSSTAHGLLPTIAVSGIRIGPHSRACKTFGKQAAG